MDNYLLLLVVIIIGFGVYYFCDKYVNENENINKKNSVKIKEKEYNDIIEIEEDKIIEDSSFTMEMEMESIGFNSKLSMLSDFASKFSSQYSASSLGNKINGDSELSIMKK